MWHCLKKSTPKRSEDLFLPRASGFIDKAAYTFCVLEALCRRDVYSIAKSHPQLLTIALQGVAMGL